MKRFPKWILEGEKFWGKKDPTFQALRFAWKALHACSHPELLTNKVAFEAMTARLKACPFCGGQAKVMKSMPSEFLVQCKEDCCYTAFYPSQFFAIQGWNRRARSVRNERRKERK